MVAFTCDEKLKIKCAVLGATGTVGQKFIILLSNHPDFEITSIGASSRSEGKLYKDAVSWKQSEACPNYINNMTIKSIVNDHYDEETVIFSALPSNTAAEVELKLAMAGKKVFSNASTHRMDTNVPILLPLVNGRSLQLVKSQECYRNIDSSGFIVTNSNCAAVGLCTALNALISGVGPIETVSCCTLQAISGAGYPGLPSLDILGNVVPHIEGEEEKIEAETNKILGTINQNMDAIVGYGLAISSIVHRVPVKDGHIVSMSVRFNDTVAKDNLINRANDALAYYVPEESERLSKCPSAPKYPIVVRSEADRPQPQLDVMEGNGFTTVCSSVRKCPVLDIKLTTLAHNTIIGAAGGSVLNAEFALANDLI